MRACKTHTNRREGDEKKQTRRQSAKGSGRKYASNGMVTRGRLLFCFSSAFLFFHPRPGPGPRRTPRGQYNII